MLNPANETRYIPAHTVCNTVCNTPFQYKTFSSFSKYLYITKKTENFPNTEIRLISLKKITLNSSTSVFFRKFASKES